MADPVSLMAIGMVGTAIGGAVSAGGKYYEGQAAGAAARYQQNVGNILASALETRAQTQLAEGGVRAEQFSRRQALVVGQQTAGYGAGNIGGATPERVRASQIAGAQWGTGIIRADAAQAAYGSSLEASEKRAGAGLEGMAAITAPIAGDIGAFGTAVSTAGTLTSQVGQATAVSSKWYDTPGPPTLYQDPNHPGGYVAGYG